MPFTVEAQIAGTVWKIETEVGSEVEPESVLLVLESMKMEIPVEATRAGRVAQLLVEEGQNVAEGDGLAILE